MRKHFLAIVAIVLILAATACTQYPDDWRDYFPQRPGDETISTIEDLFLFASSNGSAKARINLTVDPDDPDFSAYFPMTIRGTKVLSGEIEVSETHRFPNFYSSTATPPRSVLTRAASGINLFEVADDANVTISDFSATVSDDAKAEVSSIIKVNNGSLNIQDGFTVTTGTAAIEIGETATLEGLQVSGNLSSVSVVVNEANTEKDKIANKVVDDTGATVETGGESITEKYAVINTNTYEGYVDLHAAFASVQDGETLKLIKNDEARGSYVIRDKAVTLDLNGFTITLSDKFPSGFPDAYLFGVNNNAKFTLNDTSPDRTGTIDITKERDGERLLGTALAVYPDDLTKPAELIVNGGNILSQSFAIAGNGTCVTEDLISITINDGFFESKGAAIYHPHNGDLTINGGEFIGDNTAIEIRAGNLKIQGGSFTAIKTPSDSTQNGNGTTSTGSAIAIAQHTTKLPITVTITDGEFNGYSAIYESNPQKNTEEDLAKISIDIEGGTFNATNGGTAIIYSEDKTDFISGGTFNTEPKSDYIADGYHVVESGSNWTVLAD